MKKYLLILFLNAGLLATINAQPTLTQAGVAYAPGDMISTITNYGNYVNPGSGGANQTWDLSAMADSGFGIGNVVAASSLAISDSFPGSTVALVTGGADFFYTTSSSVMQATGSANGDTVEFNYTNPEDVLRFPFDYTNTYTDPWREISYSGGNARILSGTTTVTADGYGTVTTPGQTYTNAMRVHFVENYYDSLYIGIWFIHTWNYDSYRWYVNGSHYQVAEVDSTSLYYMGSLAGPSSYGGSYLNGPTGIRNVAGLNSFNAYPNPATDFLTLDVDLASSKNVEVKIFNSLGAEMQVPSMNEGIAGDNRYRLDVKKLPPGIYFAQILMEGVLTSTRQFIIAR